MKIISLAEKREEKMPHSSGVAICLDCKHEWAAVAPIIDGFIVWLECPSCGLVRGRFKYQFERNGEQWKCACKNDLFNIKPEGCYCPNCGAWQQFPKVDL